MKHTIGPTAAQTSNALPPLAVRPATVSHASGSWS